jgi:hypothetical protein
VTAIVSITTMVTKGKAATTTIQLETVVRDELRSRGRMGESYNDVIRRLLALTLAKGTSSGTPVKGSVPVISEPWVPQQDRD